MPPKASVHIDEECAARAEQGLACWVYISDLITAVQGGQYELRCRVSMSCSTLVTMSMRDE
eukprot:7388801-Prymnesium_polylepis.1